MAVSFKQMRNFSSQEWAVVRDTFNAEVSKYILSFHLAGSGGYDWPNISDKSIGINGDVALGMNCESFVLKKDLEGVDSKQYAFKDCGKPYGVFVKSMVKWMSEEFPDVIRI